MTVDPIDLTRALVRCPSVTPAEGGAITLLADVLTQAGFECHRADRGEISNLVARFGPKGARKTFGFNGHTDVVPPGNESDWSVPPFSGDIRDGWLFGRGSTDMKSGVAAFVAAAVAVSSELPADTAIVITVTGDEEGKAQDGTRAILDWMRENDEVMSVCLVGEPTCPDEMGQMMKIGRRGSMTAYFTATGVQGHSAYPHRARNPVPAMARLVDRLAQNELDTGNAHFDPSTLAVTTIDTGNPANNVIPATCRATVNIRFNDIHSSESLTAWLRDEATKIAEESGISFDMGLQISGESFITPPGPLSELVASAVQAETGRIPEASTSGGTSDARFVKEHCPVIEFGLVGKTMHQVDERVEVTNIQALTDIYRRILTEYFE